MDDRFLHRIKAKLAIAELLGFLDRWIRRRLEKATDGELWAINVAFSKRCREVAALDSPSKIPSMGSRFRSWQEHPFRKFIEFEEGRRFDLRYTSGRLDMLSIEEYKDYIEWKGNGHAGCTIHSTDDHLMMWRRERKRTLPIAAIPPTRAGLPRDPHGRTRLDSDRG